MTLRALINELLDAHDRCGGEVPVTVSYLRAAHDPISVGLDEVLFEKEYVEICITLKEPQG